MKDKIPLIDIIIVNYNATDCLIRCVESIQGQLRGIPARILVQDNSSRDGAEGIRGVMALHLTRNKRNLGFAKAVNQALRQSCAPYLLILNPDTLILPGFFHELLAFMKSRPDAAVVGPKILNRDGSLQASARAFPTALTAFFGRSSPLTRWLPEHPVTTKNLPAYKSDGVTPMEVDWVSGACMLVRREAVEQVGLLDERFFMYWEDADWCRRMRERGWKVFYYPRGTVVHFVGASSETNMFRSILEFHKSIYRLFSKYGGRGKAFLMPMVIGGMALRMPLALGSNRIRMWVEGTGNRRRRLPEAEALEPPRPRPIRIVRVISRLNIGGPSIHVYLLTKGISGDGFETTLVTGKISEQEGDMSYLFNPGTDPMPVVIPELQREISPLADVRAFFRLVRFFRIIRPDIVHTHTAKAGTSARLAAFLYNLISGRRLRLVHTFHGHVFEGYFSSAKSRLFIWIERMLAKGTDVVLAISKTQKEDLGRRFAVADPQKIRTVPLGFDLNPFLTPSFQNGGFREKWGIPQNALVVGIVGRLVAIKNHRMFFEAARLFLKRNSGQEVRFAVVGDGELREELQALCGHLGLREHVLFCGWTREIQQVYADLDILALTSINEGTPVSIIEAMASSVPVVATAVGGVVDLLGSQNGLPGPGGFLLCERGILCPKGDSQVLAEAMEYLARMDPEEREALTERAKVFVQTNFTQERLLQDMKALYRELLGGRRFTIYQGDRRCLAMNCGEGGD